MNNNTGLGTNLIHVVVLVFGIAIFGVHVGDAIRAWQVRDMVLEGFIASRFAKKHVINNVVAGRDPADGWVRKDIGSSNVDIEPHTGIITVTFQQPMAGVVGTTLVLFPFKLQEDGQYRLQTPGEWTNSVNWTCASSQSLMRYSPESMLVRRGSLPSRYAPAECRL